MIKLTASQFSEILEVYWRGEHFQPTGNGWDGWWGFFRPYSNYALPNLHKVTCKITESNTEPTEEVRKAALKKELKERLERRSQPFLNGVESYLLAKNSDKIKSAEEGIIELVTENRAELIERIGTLIEKPTFCLEFPTINAFFQRIKDLDCLCVEREEIKAQFSAPPPPKPKTKKAKSKSKGQKFKQNELGEMVTDRSES